MRSTASVWRLYTRKVICYMSEEYPIFGNVKCAAYAKSIGTRCYVVDLRFLRMLNKATAARIEQTEQNSL